MDNDLINERPKDEHGQVIHAAVSNYPSNLVRGPRARQDDPKGKLDAMLLAHQTDEYKKKAAPFINKNSPIPPTLKQFGDLPPSSPVLFAKKEDNKKKPYYVESV